MARLNITFVVAVFVVLTAQGPVTYAQNDNPLLPAQKAIRVKDYATALARLKALNGNAAAEYLLGVMYRYGLGTSIDNNMAEKFIRSAAIHGDANAAYSLAALLSTDPKKNHQAEIQSLLQQAAKAGHPLAVTALGENLLPMHTRPEKSNDTAIRRNILFIAAQQDDVDVMSAFSDAELKSTDEFGRGVLAYAALRGASRAVTLLLQHGVNVNQSDSYAVTPLMLAASAGDSSVVSQLVDAKANLDLQDRSGNNALMYAMAYKQTAVAKQLIKTAINVNTVNSQNWTALDWAIHMDMNELISTLKAQGLSSTQKIAVSAVAPALPLMHASNNDLYPGWPDLAVAASRSSAELLTAAMKTASPNGITPSGESALMVAVKSNKVAQVESLLNAGVSTSVSSTTSETPLGWAVRHDQNAIVQLLLTKGTSANAFGKNERAPLLDAVSMRNETNVKMLIKAMAKVGVHDSEGHTPLMLAAIQHQTVIVNALLSAAADADVQDNQGRTALWYAAATGAEECVRALLAARAVIDKRDSNNTSPLMIAAANAQADSVELLVSAGASVQGTEKSAALPLQLAAVGGNETIVRRLLAAGAQLDAQNKFGDTALIAAVRARQLNVTAALLKAGANTDLRNKDRATAYDVATALGFKELESLLEKHG